jgi:hypothetical protein
MESKSIGGAMMRTVSIAGNLCKTYIWVHPNGVLFIERLILIDDGHLEQMHDAIYSRFGKTLWRQRMAFKYSTLATIMKAANHILTDKEINPENIL